MCGFRHSGRCFACVTPRCLHTCASVLFYLHTQTQPIFWLVGHTLWGFFFKMARGGHTHTCRLWSLITSSTQKRPSSAVIHVSSEDWTTHTHTQTHAYAPWDWFFQTPGWRRGSPLTRTWRGWRSLRQGTGPNGTTKPSICSPAWASVWVSATCGGSLTYVRATEEVCSSSLSIKCSISFLSLENVHIKIQLQIVQWK